MAGEIIRQGDPTNHGGKVLEGSMVDICHGKPIAYIGHKVSCPKCKGTYPIVEGVMTTTFYGKGVAVAGMKTACGATLIATQFTDIVETAGGSRAAPRAMKALPIAAVLPPSNSSAPLGFSPAGPVILREQNNSGAIVSPPTQKEVDTAIAHQKPFEVTEGMRITRAITEKKISVVREGNNVTLRGTFSVFSAAGTDRAAQFIADTNSSFKGLSYISQGLTYSTDFRFNVMKTRDGADVALDYFELPLDRSQAQVNGQIYLDRSADFENIRKGVGAHEFAHAVLGIPDGYHDITMKRPEGLYYLRGVPYKEQKDSLMSDISKRIPGPDLKKIILKLESDLKGMK
jgi:uncharacterized Zn-binding protein involved in type VI secretion